LLVDGLTTDLTILNATPEGATLALPPDIPRVPHAGEMLHLLLDSTEGPLPLPIRAEVLEAVTDGVQVLAVCAFRRSDIEVAARRPAASEDLDNRRDAFRVSPKNAERIPVLLTTNHVHLEGWMVDVSAGGMRIATSSRDVQKLIPRERVRISLTIPGFETASETEGWIVRAVHGHRPYFCSVRFDFPASHSEFERQIVGYVMQRQRDTIQQLRGP